MGANIAGFEKGRRRHARPGRLLKSGLFELIKKRGSYDLRFLLPKPRDQTSVFRRSEWQILQNGKTSSGSYSALHSLAALASAFWRIRSLA